MLEISLEPTDDLAAPAFKDYASCQAWLHQLQLTNLHQAHAVLRTQLDEFNRYPMRATERLKTLELLRETVVLIQGDYAKKLVSKKLPFNEDELTIFVAILALWRSLLEGYQRCLQAYMAGDAAVQSELPLILQRCLRYTGMQIFEHVRSGYAFEGKLWHQSHRLFAYAEAQQVQRVGVADELHHPQHSSSCQSVYIKFLLACHVHPMELSRGQLQWLDRWLEQWSDLLAVERHNAASKDEAPSLVIDLMGSQGVQTIHQATISENTRYLPMMPLSKQLRVKSILLQQGQSPQQLGLGSDCHVHDCSDFLNTLHRTLCEPYGERSYERTPVTHDAALCFGVEGVYAHVARKPFKQPKKAAQSDELARKQIAAFGRILSETNRQSIEQFGFSLEDWQFENESILGARLWRPEQAGERVGTNQLVAVRAGDASTFMLGKVRWVSVTLQGNLRIGVQYIPGLPQAISIKAKGINPGISDKAQPALLLPEVAVLKTPASLIVPRDFFQADRQAEITFLDGRSQVIKMGFSVNKGVDFEQISFEVV